MERIPKPEDCAPVSLSKVKNTDRIAANKRGKVIRYFLLMAECFIQETKLK
jgi:hypothetical protein